MKRTLFTHLVTLPRWFAAPFFGASTIMGAVLAGGITPTAWWVVLAGLFLMAGGHSMNSYLDYAWTGLDRGEVEDRSAEKLYTGGQNVIEKNIVSLPGVLANALAWYIAGMLILLFVALNTGAWQLFVLGFAGMLVAPWYSWGKFNWTHELSLGVGVGPVALLLGMYAVSPSPPVGIGLLVSVPFAIILSFAGLAFDEWPDAEANLKKGVKSLAYMVWKYKVSLEFYLMSWFLFMLCYQLLLITTGVLSPLTALTFIIFIPTMACFVFLDSRSGDTAHFQKVGAVLVAVWALYPILMVIGQIYG